MICPSVWHLILRTDVDFWDSFGEEKKALPVSEWNIGFYFNIGMSDAADVYCIIDGCFAILRPFQQYSSHIRMMWG